MSYYIGLSFLSNMSSTRTKGTKLTDEARRILSQLEERHIHENDIAREPNGRPFFPDREGTDFNISHSGALAAVSYARGGNLRTGCDVERLRLRPKTTKIAEKLFSVSEQNYIFSQPEYTEARFFEIWTLKECYIKLRGLSVFDMASTPSFVRNNALAFDAAVSSPLSFILYELSDSGERYILSAALEGPEQHQPIIRWFSESSLPCKIIAEIKAAPNPAETVKPNR